MIDPDARAKSVADALLAPLGSEAFLAESYGREARHFPASDRARFADYLTTDAIESLMRAPEFFDTVGVALRVPGDEAPQFAKGSADVYENLSKGGAVQFVGIEKVLPDTHPLAAAFQALGAVIGARPQRITAFLSPPGQAIPIHKDPLEVFTLQMTGRKSWQLFDFHSPGTPDAAIDRDAAPVETVDLAPGDILYVPKGQAHLVEAGSGLSITASLVFAPPSWTRLADVLAETIGDDRAFWRAMPPSDVAGDFEEMRAKLAAALDALDPAEFAAQIAAERTGYLKGLPANHIATVLAIESFAPETLVRRRPGPPPVVRMEGEKALLISAYDDPVRGPGDAFDAFRYIAAATGPFRIDAICPRLSASSKIAIARKLARRGIVQIAD